jgi:deoxyadenosine/deoxycytidine kinase
MSGRQRRTIAIAGNIGAGKSTLVEFLTSSYGIEPFYEPNDDNPYLKDFYGDMRRWAFHSQTYFLASKFRIHQQLDQTAGISVLDRTIYEDAEIFAAALHQMRKINARDWQTYRSFYEVIVNAIQPPDLMIYLHCNLRTLRQRIRLRGRRMEQNIPLSYLKRLDGLYSEWISNYRLGPLLILDSGRLDYIHDMVDRLDVMEQVEALLPKSLRRGR